MFFCQKFLEIAKKNNKTFFDLLVPVLFVVLVFCIIPVKQTFEFNPDEGLNLMKAVLYSQGFSLYKEIWSDQPPILTVLLSYWFNLFGQSVFAARVFILIFSTLLIWSFYQIIQSFLGRFPAIIGTILLVCSSFFINLSVSVMIGIPSLSLAMFSIYTFNLYKHKHHKIFLITSACLLAISLQTKLFTAFLIPIILLLFFNAKKPIKNNKNIKNNWLLDILIFLAILITIYGIVSILFDSINSEQLWQPHVVAKSVERYQEINFFLLIPAIYRDYALYFLALIGILAIFAKKRWDGLFPIAWLVTATLLLLDHKPVWYHHYLLLSIPLAWLSSYGVIWILDFFQKEGWSFNFKKQLVFPCLATVLLIVAMVRIPIKMTQQLNTPDSNSSTSKEVVEILLKHSESTRWVFTDRPILAFYAGLPIPPEVAVFTEKRLVSGNLGLDDLWLVLQKYRPEQIVLVRWTEYIKSDKNIKNYLEKNYLKTYQKDSLEHYLLKSYS